MKKVLEHLHIFILPLVGLIALLALYFNPTLIGDILTFIVTGALPHSNWSFSPTTMLIFWTLAGAALIGWGLFSLMPEAERPLPIQRKRQPGLYARTTTKLSAKPSRREAARRVRRVRKH